MSTRARHSSPAPPYASQFGLGLAGDGVEVGAAVGDVVATVAGQEVMAIGVAPTRLAMWIAARPTLLEAAFSATTSPARIPPTSTNAPYAVR
ncbi:hypothetical protein ACFV0L_04260 [Streptosporangium canum]|uniref:hypothetical protein n=1 Tax=Streptosporangium canum TaxID=324952 RepID=UPI00369CDC51